MSPLTAIAIPAATAAATQLVREVVAQRPFASFFGVAEATPTGPVASLGGLLDELRTAIADRLAAAGLDPSSSFELSTDASGQLVIGDHPQRSQIAAALADDSGIRELFQQISSLQKVLDAAQRQLDFAQRYALDPLASLAGGSSPRAPLALQFAAGELAIQA